MTGAGADAAKSPVPHPGDAAAPGRPGFGWSAAGRRRVSHQVADLVADYLRTDGDEDGPGGPRWFSE